jgi:hypothetical protein
VIKAGGWIEDSDEPEIGTGELFNTFSLNRHKLIFGNKAEEGVRRAICDMTRLLFH